MVMVDAVNDPVQARSDPALGLEVEGEAVDGVLAQRPEDVAADGAADRLEHGDPLQREDRERHDRGHEEQRHNDRVNARQLVEDARLEHLR